ncbi:hypothetical protein [Actinoplanes sp. L3-i22]|uniref:hypothetical protein n=1 Tax=Actinoplanes sp. L3-i22 TaxID=2836373 RepID=UPI002106AD66|nr:hypothetical protein [Actinoplanes sp. L3-i22]
MVFPCSATSSTANAVRISAVVAYIADITSARSASCIMSAFHWSLIASLTVAISSFAAVWSDALRTAKPVTRATDRSPAAPMETRRPTIVRETDSTATPIGNI